MNFIYIHILNFFILDFEFFIFSIYFIHLRNRRGEIHLNFFNSSFVKYCYILFHDALKLFNFNYLKYIFLYINELFFYNKTKYIQQTFGSPSF